MGTTTIHAQRDDQNVPLNLLVGPLRGGVTGLTVVVAIRQPSTGFYLDFGDDTFKAAFNVAAMAEVDAVNSPGQYQLLLDLSAITNLPAVGPAGQNILDVEYEYTGTVAGVETDLLIMRTTLHEQASQAQALAASAAKGISGELDATPGAITGELDATPGAITGEVGE